MAVGFIGLGNLGRAIVTRLMAQGETVGVYNRTREKAEGLGCEIYDSPKSLVEDYDTVMLCLFESDAVEAVLNMEGGLLDSDLTAKTVIDLTTNHFEDVISFHAAIKAYGGSYLECPVFGSVAPALQGALTLVASGDQATFEAQKPLLNKIGKEIFHLPPAGQATKMKLINNLCLGAFMATIAEATALGEACEIDKKALLEILGVGGGQSLVLKAKTQKLIDEDFTPHFSNAAIYKDLQTLEALSYTLKRPLYTASAAKALFAKSYERGEAEEDFSSIYKLLK